jgi:hypothetical protein
VGQRVVPLERQSAQPAYAKYRENVRWTVGDVVFLTLSLPGSNNNRGTDATAAPVEFTERNAATWRGCATASRLPRNGPR